MKTGIPSRCAERMPFFIKSHETVVWSMNLATFYIWFAEFNMPQSGKIA